MIQPETLDMPALNCSLESELGDYYQDFSGAITLVEAGYHGDVDGDGVPRIVLPGRGNFHSATMTSQYALACMDAVRRGDTTRTALVGALLDSLVTTQEQSGPFAGTWLMQYDNPKYPWLRAPWTSALALGNALSALLRGAELTGDGRYRAAADAAYDALHAAPAGVALVVEEGEDLWYEEYPADTPLHVLNGHVYALLGVLDYWRVSGDTLAGERWHRAAATTARHLDGFDLGFWSAYDLRWREPVSRHYHKNIHIPQLRVLAALTGDGRFTEVADRWARYLESPIARARSQIALRTHRWRKR